MEDIWDKIKRALVYITNQILKHHQGKIWVESILGKGSTFYIALPLSTKEQLQD